MSDKERNNKIITIDTSPDSPYGVRKLRGYVGLDYSVVRDSYGSVYVVDLDIEEYPTAKEIEEFANKYPHSAVPATGYERRVMDLRQERHRFIGDTILLPKHVTAELHYDVSNDQLDILKDKTEREGVEWRGKIKGEDMITELIPSEQQHLIHEYQDNIEEINRSVINKRENGDTELFYQATVKQGLTHCMKRNCSIHKPVHHFMKEEYLRVKKLAPNAILLGTQMDSKDNKDFDWLVGMRNYMVALTVMFPSIFPTEEEEI